MKRYKLGSKDFVDGVCFVIEELLLLQSLQGVEDLFEKSELVNYKDEIAHRMNKNNPGIYEDYFVPLLDEDLYNLIKLKK